MTDSSCHTCGKSHPWEDGTMPRHPFNDGSLRGSAILVPPKDKTTEVRESRWPFDPVLRQALIDKGVLVPQDLRDAEDKIRAIAGEVNERE